MSSSSDYAAAVEVPNVSAVAAVPGLAVNDGHSGHKIAVFDGLPIEIFLLIIDHLEIFSVIRFSMASRSLYDFVHSRAVSMALALRCLHVEKIPATSFLLPQMESSELVKLITRVDRFIWAANRTSLSKDPPRGKRTNINLVIPDSAEAFYPLGMYEAEDDRQYPHARSALLPGGRWVVTISGATRWHFSCYDLQALVADGFYEPVATIVIKPDREGVSPLIQEFEYCKRDSAFTFLISSQESYMIRDELFGPGWHCILRVHIEPVSSTVTISTVPLPSFYQTRDWHLNLSGDFVSLESLDRWIAFDNLAPSQALLWNWRRDIASNIVPSHIPPKNAMRRGRFIPTPDGSLIQLEASASESILRLTFTIWTHPNASNRILEPARSAYINIELPRHENAEVTYVDLEKWEYCDSSDDIFMILSIGQDWDEFDQYLVLNKSSGLARLLYHEGVPNPSLHDKSTSNLTDFFFALYKPSIRGMVRRASASGPPVIEMEPDDPDVLIVSLTYGHHSCKVVFPALEDDKDRRRESGPRPFCPRSGRWVLSAELFSDQDIEDEDEDDIVKPPPDRKSYCPYMIVDPLE